MLCRHRVSLAKDSDADGRWRRMSADAREQVTSGRCSAEKEHRTLYDVLQVSPDASPEVLNAAWRVLARQYHPDVNPTDDAGSLMSELNEAYNLLRDAGQRADYDRALRQLGVSVPQVPSWKGVRRQRTCWLCQAALDPFAAYCSDCRWLICESCTSCGCQYPKRAAQSVARRCDVDHPEWLVPLLNRPGWLLSGLLGSSFLLSALWVAISGPLVRLVGALMASGRPAL